MVRNSLQIPFNLAEHNYNYVNPAILKKLIEVENSKEFKITNLFNKGNLTLSTYLL